MQYVGEDKMKKIVINDKEYELIKNYKDGFDLEEVKSLLTDFFDMYDYIAGDWAYNKLRLKGFMESNNPKVKKINDIKLFDVYIDKNCAKNCRYFLIKKI